MTVQEAVVEAKARGLTHVQTSGGLISLDDWKPYGKAYSDHPEWVEFSWRDASTLEDRIYNEPETPPGDLNLGIWPLYGPPVVLQLLKEQSDRKPVEY